MLGHSFVHLMRQHLPVNPEVFLLHILDDQAVPLHFILLPGHHRLGVVFCIVRCHRPRECAFLTALACQRPILAHLGFYKYGTLLLLVQHKTWSNQFTNMQDCYMHKLSSWNTWVLYQPLPLHGLHQGSLLLKVAWTFPSFWIRKIWNRDHKPFLCLMARACLRWKVNKQRRLEAGLRWLAYIRASGAVV